MLMMSFVVVTVVSTVLFKLLGGLRPSRSLNKMSQNQYILNINEKLPLSRVYLTQDHIWIFLDGELPSAQLSIFVVYSPLNRYYRKRCSSHMNARYPFTNEHQILPLSYMGPCQVVVVPESLSLACSI